MKIVLDTNIFISAFLWQKIAKGIFIFAQNKNIQICVNQELLEEFQTVLEYDKFNTCLEKVRKTPREIIDEFLEIVKIYPSLKFQKTIIEEYPSDDKVLACALICGADFIISGDKHLLKLKIFENISILSPRQFLDKFGNIEITSF